MTEGLPKLIRFMERHLILGPEYGSSGAFRVDGSEYMIEPARALEDPNVREVICQFGARMGKNLLMTGHVARTVVDDPGNVLFYSNTQAMADVFVEQRLFKDIRDLDVLSPLWPTGYKARKAQRKTEAILPHMSILPLGANESGLQSKMAKHVNCDEVFLYNRGMYSQAKKRGDDFWNAKIFAISTAGDEGGDMDEAFKSGTMELWHVGCPHCKELIKLTWATKPRVIQWDTNEVTKPPGKGWNLKEAMKTVRFVCPHCETRFKDTPDVRKEMNRLGKYVVTNPDAVSSIRSFQASQIASPSVPWETIAADWIKAMEVLSTGDKTNLREFIIRRMAETWEVRERENKTMRITGGYELGDMRWDAEKERIMIADVQGRGGTHFWVVLRAFSDTGESRLYGAWRVNTFDEIEKLRVEHKVGRDKVAIDARYDRTKVIQACARYGWLWLMADEKNRSYSHRVRGTQFIIQKSYSERQFSETVINKRLYRVQGFHYSKSWAREVLYNRMTGSGSVWEVPVDVDKLRFEGTNHRETSYIQQIGSWYPDQEKNKVTGGIKEVWKQGHRDDHLQACEEGALVRAAMMRLIPSELSEPVAEESPQ